VGDIGLDGKPVVNTIVKKKPSELSIDTVSLQHSINSSRLGIDISEKVLAFKEKVLRKQLEKIEKLNQKGISMKIENFHHKPIMTGSHTPQTKSSHHFLSIQSKKNRLSQED
jgi:hypothetical protein